MTKEQYQANLDKIYNKRYKLLSDCKQTSDRVTILDTVCGQTFDVIANEFTRKRVQERNKKSCPCCRPDKSLKKEFCQQELDKLTGNKVEIINYGGTSHADSTFKCRECGNEWIYSYHGLMGNLKDRKTDKSWGCAKCSNKKKKEHDDFVQEVKDLYDNIVEVVGKYTNTNTPIAVKCNICGCIYNPYPVDLLYKYKQKHHTHGCPKCYENRSDSAAVIFIKNILDENNIPYQTGVSFENCKYKKKLPFDFELKNEKGESVLIEYDGDQHDTGWKGNTKNLEVQQKRDKIKDNFCENNNIPFLRLRYTQTWDEMEKELYKFLKDNNIGSL